MKRDSIFPGPAGLACLLAMSIALPLSAQTGASEGEWRHYAGDRGSTKYSALDQIDRDNFSKLEVAWRWQSADAHLEESVELRPGHFRGTPLMVAGVVYQPTGLGQVAALDAGSGETLWVYDPRSYERGSVVHGLVQIRGIEFWTDGEQQRILIATGGRQLVSLDTETGKPDPAFGNGGVVDLTEGLGRDVNNNIGHSAPVITVGDTIVVGSLVFDFPTRNSNPPGHVRGYDVRSGELKWRFHSIPQEGEPYNDTWENDAWKTVGNTNVWSMMSADPELGYVYLPFGTPTNDYYGGHRHGDNVYAESLVCLRADTGELVWHFQGVHHGIWDYDFASAPNLVDITVDGKRIKAVAQVSKQGMTYVFDRVTGEPVWPIEERPVAHASTVPGEKLSPTQPFPTKPPPFEDLGSTVDRLIDFTPELRAEALEITKEYVLGPIFTPTIVGGTNGKIAAIINPGAGGGANWPGASIDPETGILYVESQTRPSAMGLVIPDAARSDWRYILDRQRAPTVQGLPLLKPPYRRITAIDLSRGDHAWQIPFGEGPTQHPAIRHLNLGPLGSSYPRGIVAEGGLLITKTVLVAFQAQLDELGDRQAHGSFLQAYDKATGKLLAQVEVDRSLHSSPMTYLHKGRQYIVVAGGGGGRGTEPAEKSELIAFALPAESSLEAEIDRRAAELEDKVIAWRRDIHQNPELGNREFRTAALVAEHLKSLGLEVRTEVAHTGVVGLLRGGDGPVVALRADMDGLPVTERVDVPFASKVKTTYNGSEVGVMHACGHDNHVAILMATAEVLAGMRDRLPGSVKFIFQPAEEGAPAGEEGGADLMLAQGAFDDPRPEVVFGLHVFPYPVGTVAYRSGGAMASSDGLRIVVRGRQTHGAVPWGGVDPIVTAAQVIMGLQTIVSRQVNSTRTPSIITIGSIHGGVRGNIIPDEVDMVGTIRTFDPGVQDRLHELIRNTAESIARSMGATAEVTIRRGNPVTINDPDLTSEMIPVLRRVAGEGAIEVDPTTTAEDFSYFANEVPGLFVFLGIAPEGSDPRTVAPNHSPYFAADEGALVLGVRTLASLALAGMER